MKKTIFFKIIALIFFVLSVGSLFSMKRKANVWEDKNITKYVKYFIDEGAGEIKKVANYNVCYKKVRDDLIVVQLFVPLQKLGECVLNSLAYSDLFAHEKSPLDYLKKAWDKSMKMRIESLEKLFSHHSVSTSITITIMLGKVKLGVYKFFEEVGNSGVYRILIPSQHSGKKAIIGSIKENSKGVDPRLLFRVFKRPFTFVSGTLIDGSKDHPHAISGRIEWVPNTNTKILFFSDSWYPKECVIDKYAKEFKDLVDALASTE